MLKNGYVKAQKKTRSPFYKVFKSYDKETNEIRQEASFYVLQCCTKLMRSITALLSFRTTDGRTALTTKYMRIRFFMRHLG